MGFASRAAALNGLTLQTLLREMRVPHLDVDHGREGAVRDVARLGGLNRSETEALIRYTPRRHTDERASSVAGEKFGPGSIHRTFFRFCPHCVQEDLTRFEGPAAARPWLRLEWLIDHVRSCRTHDVSLLEARPIRRRFEAFDFAESLRDQVLPKLDLFRRAAGTRRHSGFEDWVVARLDGTGGSADWLDDVPLRVGTAFCEALGVSALHSPKVKTAGFGTTDWADAAERGYLVSSAGEAGFREFLLSLDAAQAGTRGVLGLRDTYGYLYGLLQRTLQDPAFEKFRAVLRDHAFQNLPLEPGTDVLGTVLERRRVHTAHSASMASGVHVRTIRRMLARRGLKEAAKNSGLRDHRVIFGAEDVEGALTKLKDAMTTPAVIRATGIPRHHLGSMISQGILPTVMQSEKEAYAKHRIARGDVAELMKRLFEGAAPGGQDGPRRVSVMEARRFATASIDDVVAFILGPDPRWKGYVGDGTRYEHLLIDADELTAFVRKEPPLTGLTKNMVQQLIPGLGNTSVRDLSSMRVLKTVEEFSPDARRNVWVVTRASVETFKARYVALGELCQTTGLHHKKVRMRLRLAGVEHVFPYVKAGAFFYPRAAAARAMV